MRQRETQGLWCYDFKSSGATFLSYKNKTESSPSHTQKKTFKKRSRQLNIYTNMLF